MIAPDSSQSETEPTHSATVPPALRIAGDDARTVGGVDVIDEDGSSLPGDLLRVGPAQPLARPGDDDALAFELHVPLFYCTLAGREPKPASAEMSMDIWASLVPMVDFSPWSLSQGS